MHYLKAIFTAYTSAGSQLSKYYISVKKILEDKYNEPKQFSVSIFKCAKNVNNQAFRNTLELTSEITKMFIPPQSYFNFVVAIIKY